MFSILFPALDKQKGIQDIRSRPCAGLDSCSRKRINAWSMWMVDSRKCERGGQGKLAVSIGEDGSDEV